jgi:hypothetical protein
MEIILSVIGAILLIVSTVFGFKWKKVKKIARGIVNVADEVVSAVEDDKVTEDEVKRIAKKGKRVIDVERKKV